MMAPDRHFARLRRGRRIGCVHRFIAADIDFLVEIVRMSFKLLFELLVRRAGVGRRWWSLLFVVVHWSVAFDVIATQ